MPSNKTRAGLMSALRENAVPVGGVNDMEAVFEQPPAEALVVREQQPQGQGQQEEGCLPRALGVRQVAYQRKDGPESAYATATAGDGSGEGSGELLSLRPPPRYAEHTREILSDMLGMDEDEIDQHLQQGSVVQG